MAALTINDINRLALDAAGEDRRRRAPDRVIQPQRAAHTAPEDPDPPTILLGGQFKLEGLEIEGPGGRIFECAAVALVENGVDVESGFGDGKSWKDAASTSIRDRFDSFLRSRRAQLAAREALREVGMSP